jgi:hypothetical protein
MAGGGLKASACGYAHRRRQGLPYLLTDLARQYHEGILGPAEDNIMPILTKQMRSVCARIIQNGGFLHTVF